MGTVDQKYDPATDQQALALAIIEALDGRGFGRDVTPPGAERVYRQPCKDDRAAILIYTSVVDISSGPVVREVGSDAIRVVGVFRNHEGQERGIVKETRIHRVGLVRDIVDRIGQRVADVRSRIQADPCPRCGAPTFLAKPKEGQQEGRRTCADLCWKVRPGRRVDEVPKREHVPAISQPASVSPSVSTTTSLVYDAVKVGKKFQVEGGIYVKSSRGFAWVATADGRITNRTREFSANMRVEEV